MRRLRRAMTRRDRDERGATAVEFALVLLFVLLPLMTGMLEYGWYLHVSQSTGAAARDTARRLSVGDCLTGTAAQDYARGTSGLKDLTLVYGAPAATAPPASSIPAVGSTVRVWAQDDGALFQFLPLPFDGLVTRTVDARVEDNTQETPC